MQAALKATLSGIRVVAGLVVAVEGSVIILIFVPAMYDTADAVARQIDSSSLIHYAVTIAPVFAILLAFAGLALLVARIMPTIPTTSFGQLWRRILRKQRGYRVKGWPTPSAGMDA